MCLRMNPSEDGNTGSVLGSRETIGHYIVHEGSELHMVEVETFSWKLLAVLPHSYFNANELLWNVHK